MSRSKNSRRGSRRGNWNKGFWSKRADSKLTDCSGTWAKKRTAKIERQSNKVKDEDWQGQENME